MTMMLATPMAPTSSATAPKPRNRALNAPLASAWAARAADAQELGGGGAQHADRLAGGGRVEELALGQAGVGGGGQA